jgi:NAD+ synthase
MNQDLTIALAQINPTVGDVDGNIGRARAVRAEAAAAGADLVVGGELLVAGYPPEDLVLKPAFIECIEATVEAFARETADGGPAFLLGAPWRMRGRLFNAALLLDGGRIAADDAQVRPAQLWRLRREAGVSPPVPLPEPVAFRGARLAC